MTRLTAAMRGKRAAYFAGAAFTVLAILLRLWDPLPLQVLRLKTFDFYQRLEPRVPTGQPVAIIDLDEESLAAYGQWPWPRTIMARLVDELTRQGVVVIGFDIVFAEPDRTSPARMAEIIPGLDAATREILASLPSNDTVFAAALKRSRSVLGHSTTTRARTGAAVPVLIKTSVGRKSVKGARDPIDMAFAFADLVRNLPELEAAASGIGLFTLKPEVDGIVRRVPMVARVGDELYPSLVVEMLRVAFGKSRVLVEGDIGGITQVRLTPRLAIPTDGEGRAWVNFAPHDRARYVSAKDVLDGTLPPGRLQGHFAILGTSAVGLLDIKSTPVNDAMPGVEVHAQLLETVLEDLARQQLRGAVEQLAAMPTNDQVAAQLEQARAQLAAREALGPAFLVRPNYALMVEVAGLLVISVLMAVMVTMLGAVGSLLVGGTATAGLLGASWYLYVQHGILLDVAYLAVAGFVLYTMLTYFSYMREEAERRQVRDAFGHYMSPALVEQLAENPEKLHLGGEMKDMTLLFCDVRGFTAISELYKSDPQGLTSLINRFLTPTTDAILERLGTIDKYMGDCIMAFWNAPLDDDDHAGHACGSALEMMRRVIDLNVTLEAEAEAEDKRFIPIIVGIGLNSGECCVGNMGSEQRFDYSVLGDAVNLASRLEGQSKTYGVGIVIGESTRQRAPDYATIELDLIRVKGKTEAVRIFALLGEPETRREPAFEALAESHAAMLAAYRGQRWSEARTLAAECRRLDGKISGLYDLYDERIDDYEANPPGDDWDGIFVATSK